MFKFLHLSFLISMVFLLMNSYSCNEIECNFEEDQKIITDYLTANNLTATKTESGLHYIILEEGKGTKHPDYSSNVKVKYKGYFSDGVVFDESVNGVNFQLGGLIAGWQEGMALMKKEGKSMFFIPSSLGYGVQSPGGYAGRECSVLIFELELVDFQ